MSPPRQPFPGFSHQSTRPHPPRRHHRELVALAATLIRTVSMSRSLYAASARSIVALIALSSAAGTSNDVTSPCGILAKLDDSFGAPGECESPLVSLVDGTAGSDAACSSTSSSSV